jgi:hypothetical protein
MGFNKKIVGEQEIIFLTDNPSVIEFYLKCDVIFFSNEKVQIKFNKIKDDYIKRTSFK